jgi:hypothetical protein
MLENPAGLIYGTLIVGALLDAESAARQNYLDTVGAVLLALLLYWLAHSYAHFAGERIEHRETLRLSGLGNALFHGLPILVGAGVPLIAMIICWIIRAPLGTAVNVGIYVSAGMVLVIELVAALRAELSGIWIVTQTVFGALLGALIIALKLVLH